MRKFVAISTLAAAVTAAHAQGGPGGGAHAPIVIRSDADFSNCACVVTGSGTASDPFTIGPWTINGVTSSGVSIDGTNLSKSFVLSNLTIAGNSAASATGVILNHINPSGVQTLVAKVTGTQTTIAGVGVAILVENSSFVTLDGGGANPNGPGIVNTAAGTLNKNASGSVDVENSSNVTVRGWQMSASGPSIQPDWQTLDPSVAIWSVGGVRFFGVTASTIDHNAINNSTNNSISLFNSSHNTVSDNQADYPFTTNYMVADGSSYNTLTGNVGGTADFIGYLIADPLPGTATLSQFGPSHDNVLTNNVSHTNGPTGTEIQNGVAPAFLGGFVVLNGTFNNKLQNNQGNASFGSDFAWAQAVPASGGAINVAAFPPAIHCNVTASEGGGGVANRNGNVWTGNSAQTIDSCIPAQ
jgi:hypothetical protein